MKNRLNSADSADSADSVDSEDNVNNSTDLKEHYSYNPKTGHFYNKFGYRIGTGTKRGYVLICIKNVTYYAQILAYYHQKNRLPKKVLTFKDKNPSNLKWDNIEEVDKVVLARRNKIRSNNTSGITGVCFCKQTGKWKASLFVDSKNIFCGRFEHFDDAVLARYNAEKNFGYLKDNPKTSAAQYLEVLDEHYKHNKQQR